MSCDTCPDIIDSTIAAEVQKTLTKVRRIKYLSTTFNRLFAEIADKIEDDLQALIDLIPAPPVLDVSDIVDFLTCPLTPVAVDIDLTLLNTLDPRRLVLRIKQIIQHEVDAVIKLYETAVTELRSYDLVRLVRKYIQEMYRVMEDATEFLLEYPVNFARAAYVQTTCPKIYANPAYPFQALVAELTGWSFDGLIPSDVDDRARTIVSKLAEGETKLLVWKTVGTIIV